MVGLWVAHLCRVLYEVDDGLEEVLDEPVGLVAEHLAHVRHRDARLAHHLRPQVLHRHLVGIGQADVNTLRHFSLLCTVPMG